jgi:beta-N-acetylhexosaminidase
MSLDARIGRVLMVAPPPDWRRGSLTWLESLQPAGVILFRRHLPDDPDDARAAIARLQAWTSERGETLLVAMDEEGGFVTQANHLVPAPPSARALAWGAQPHTVADVYQRYGRRLRALGMNLDFAPVCDINNNPRNPVIGVRSFGSEPEHVVAYAAAAQKGLDAAGVLSCLKHFPGHGDTDVDSHLARPALPHERARLDAIELRPFRELLGNSPSVMVAHLACPRLGDADLPATLSPRVATTLLRDELGFEGVAVTDAMEMQGVAAEYAPGEAAARALQAGCDLLLHCSELDLAEKAREGLRQALESGDVAAARLEEATSRVDRLRALAVARADQLQAVHPLGEPEQDRRLYAQICRAALRIDNKPAWQMFSRTLRSEGAVHLVGWDDELLGALRQRLQAHDAVVRVTSPEAALEVEPAATVFVMAERRPLDDGSVRRLHHLAQRQPSTLLANLLTPEVDAPVESLFAARMRSADRSDTMLDAVVERWLEMAEER